MIFMCRKNRDEFDESKYTFSDNTEIRDGLYTYLLENYIKTQNKSNKTQHWFKIIFFALVLIVFVGVTFSGIICLLLISSKEENITWADVGVALTGFGSILGVVILLPTRISENLFPATASKEIIEIVSNMQRYDSRDYNDEKRTNEKKYIIDNVDITLEQNETLVDDDSKKNVFIKVVEKIRGFFVKNKNKSSDSDNQQK